MFILFENFEVIFIFYYYENDLIENFNYFVL